MGEKLADIIVDNRALSTSMIYTYSIPEYLKEDIEPGIRVAIPFGRGNRIIKGLVVNVKEDFSEFDKYKDIIDVLDSKPIISQNLIQIAFWMKEKYLCSYIDALNTVLPPGDYKEINIYIYITDTLNRKNYCKLDKNEKKVVNYIKQREKVNYNELRKVFQDVNIKSILNKLEKHKFIYIHMAVDTIIDKKYENYIALNREKYTMEKIKSKIPKNAYKQREIVDYLEDKEYISIKELNEYINVYPSTINSMKEKKIINIIKKEVMRDPLKENIPSYDKHVLTEEQSYCVDTIFQSVRNYKNDKYLLYGVTGSGKTEVYLQLIEKTLKLNRQAIVLVPEISLTPQTIDRFVGRFGRNVAVLHSRLSQGERFDEWRKIKENKVQIAVGARSAIFAPFDNLGLIIIDEEHEMSYKSSMNPKYDTKEVAEKRGELENATVVLGTATPCIETYYKAESGVYDLLKLTKRINNNELPDMKIVDMREELEKGNRSIFSIDLFNAIKENLENKKQTILFLNRRGYSTFVSCRKCGYVVKCKKCDIAMTYHFANNMLKCHYCGATMKPLDTCPNCNSKYIKYFGVGTQKVEKLVKKYFPSARVARMDMDTTTRKGSHERILNKFKNDEIDILIGTQMISKGLDFPMVTLVGIIAADTSLNLPDFRASERTFQMLTQVGGRAGRGNFKGKVIIQTYNPDHFSIQLSKDYDYDGFYRKEKAIRKEFEYPPFVDLINIIISGEDENKVIFLTKKYFSDIANEIKEYTSYVKMIGPNPAPISKIKNRYRWQVLLKSDKRYTNLLKSIIWRVCIDNERSKKDKNIKISIDIDPNSII